jgi:hypothetical protein
MKAELSFTFESLEELHDFTAKMAVPVPAYSPRMPSELEGASAVAGFAKAPAEEPRTTKVRKTKTAEMKSVAVVDLPATEEQEPATATVDAVRAAISAVNEKFGLVPARKVLNQFGVKRIPELKPEQYADFVKACSAVK